MFKGLVSKLRTLFGYQAPKEFTEQVPKWVSLSFSDFVSKVEELRPHRLMIDHSLANGASLWRISFVDEERTYHSTSFDREMWVPDSWTQVAKDGPFRIIHLSESESVIAGKFARLWDHQSGRSFQVVTLTEAFYDVLR